MLNELREEDINLNKEIGNIKMEMENIKMNQSEIKNTLTKMKNTLQGINSGVDEAKDEIRDLEDKEAKSTELEQQEEKRIFPNEDSIRSLWDNFKHTNICTMGGPEGKERKQGIENLFQKIITENFLNFMKKMDIQV